MATLIEKIVKIETQNLTCRLWIDKDASVAASRVETVLWYLERVDASQLESRLGTLMDNNESISAAEIFDKRSQRGFCAYRNWP